LVAFGSFLAAISSGCKSRAAGIYALPGLLLLVELVWLIAVYLAAYVRRTTPPPK
jgi:hypothetical protein